MNLTDKLNNDLIHTRLLNWGRWLRNDSTFARLGYPSHAPYLVSPSKGKLIAALDAQHIEYIVSTLAVSGIDRAVLYAFILKVEYAERKNNEIPHVSQRAKDVRRRFKCPCAERTYYHHLNKAKQAVQAFAEEIK